MGNTVGYTYMKIVLLKDVKNMGRAGSAHEVSDGHALNMLIPKGMAILATPHALKRAEETSKMDIDRKELDAKLISDRLTALAEETVTIVKKANDKGHLYDAVDAEEIATATALPVDAIHIEKPFKELGTFEVPVSYGGNFGKVSITIEAE
jgi:large subunit ribosomal protein L9